MGKGDLLRYFQAVTIVWRMGGGAGVLGGVRVGTGSYGDSGWEERRGW